MLFTAHCCPLHSPPPHPPFQAMLLYCMYWYIYVCLIFEIKVTDSNKAFWLAQLSSCAPKFNLEQILEPLELSRVRFLPWCCNRHIRFPHNFTPICLIKPPWSRIDYELLPLDSYMVCLGALDWMMLWIVSLALGSLDCGCAPLRIDGCWNKAPAVDVFASPYAVS